MKKKIIKSLKISSLLGFASNNIKADYNLTLTFDIFENNRAIFKLEGVNKTILNDPTLCKNNFLNVVKHNKTHHNVNNFEDIKNNYVPVYYYLKGQEDPKICIVYANPFGKEQEIGFNGNEENVEEVVWVKKSDKNNIVTFCSDNNIENDIKSTKFLVDEKYIYNLFLKMYPENYKSIDDVKKIYDINITSDKDGNQNIEIIQELTLKISDTEEFKISEKEVKENDFITPLNKLKNLYINTKDLDKLLNKDLTIKNKAIKYIFAYKAKKYYIISDEKLKGDKLFDILQTKENLKGKELKFDSTTPLKKEADDTVVPGEYKLIDKVMQKPIVFKYKFTGDSTAFKFNPEEEEEFTSKIKPLSKINSNEKSNYMEDGKTYNTVKYDFVAINKDTNKRFVNDQELEPGTYELKREEKTKDDKTKNKGQGQGEGPVNPEKAKKCCNCC